MRFLPFIPFFISWFGQFLINTLRTWTKPITATLLVRAVTDFSRSRHDLILENALLCQQLMVLNRQVRRSKLRGDRAAIVGLASRLATWKNALLIVKPEAVLRWHCDLYGTGKSVMGS